MPEFDALQPYSFTCKISPAQIVTQEHIAWAINITHRIAKHNGNTEWNKRIVCVTDDDDEILHHLSYTQITRYTVLPTAFKDLGATWQRTNTGSGTAAIWLRASQDKMSYVDTLAHELAHVVTRTAHGWVWRRMCIILTPLIRAHVYYDMNQLDVDKVREHAFTIVSYYFRKRTSNTNLSMHERMSLEVNKHVAAAQRIYDKFKQYLNISAS